MSATLIVGAAPVAGFDDYYRRLLGEHPVVLAADAAGEWCAGLGRVPDVVIGDFDSAAPGAAERLVALGARIVSAPVHKDESDLDLCVAHARECGAASLAFTAAFSERVDHTLCAFGTVLAGADLDATVFEPTFSAWTVSGPSPRTLTLVPGTTFSVLAPGGASGVSIRGGRYPLVDGVLPPLSSRGLSNVSESSEVVIGCRSGVLLVVAPVVDSGA